MKASVRDLVAVFVILSHMISHCEKFYGNESNNMMMIQLSNMPLKN